MRWFFLSRLMVLTLCSTCLPELYAQEITNQEEAATSNTLKMEETQVTAERERTHGYAVEDAVSANKTGTPLLEIPQAISVVPRALLDDQDARKLDDVLKNVSGVTVGGYYGEWDYYRIRGFDVSYNGTYLDGLLNDSAPGEELWGLEHVEVVKGPASSLYGSGTPGGFVNLISKRPRSETFADTQFTIGSYNYYEPAVDLNATLNDAKTIYARLNFLYRNSGLFVDYAGAKRVFFAPSLTWEITPDTSLTLLPSYRDDNMNLAFPLPARGTVLPNPNGEIPISRYIGNPAYGNDEWERTLRLGYEFKHRFDEHLSLRQNFRWFRLDQTSDDLSYPSSLDADDRTLGLSGYRAVGTYEGLRVDSALDAVFKTGPVPHLLTVGVDYRQTDIFYDSQDAVDLIYLDVFDPDYGALPPYAYGPSSIYKEADSDFGFYVQEHAKFFNLLTLTFGGRYDHSVFEANPNNFWKDSFTPRVGVTYEFVPGAALYANYSESFKPQWFNTDAAGKPVEPETGENYEIGLKTALLDGRLNTLLALYHLTRQNVATPDLNTSDPFDSIVSGAQRSRGVEFEASLQLIPGWDLTTAYTYTDAEITKDNALPVGARLPGVPEYTFSVWTKYTLQDGPLRGLGFGLGGHFYTEQEGDITFSNPFELPAYGVMDAAVYYERGPFHVQVNVDNVLDERYFIGAYDQLYVLPGEPLTVQATLGWGF